MNSKVILLATAVACAALTPLSAQEGEEATVDALQISESELPEPIFTALKSAERETIFNVGTETIDRPVIVADKIVFNRGAIAQISKFDWPRVIFFAEEILFANAEVGAQIMRPIDVQANKPDAPDQAAAYPKAGRDGRDGRDGVTGRSGATGRKGETISLPDIWIITNRIGAQGSSDPSSTKVNLRIWMPGIDGSEGGDGGRGGDGQAGGDGRDGKARLGICSRGPGGGGDGGRAGRGGRGGDGGNGSNGVNVNFVGPRSVIDVLQYTSISNWGGEGGSAGSPGAPGSKGKGGSRGSWPGTCDGPPAGSEGPAANPVDLGSGEPGDDGRKGAVVAYIQDDVGSLLSE